MTLEGNFMELRAKWERLVEELEHGLLWSVLETKPNEEHALANQYIDAATDLIATARLGLAACQNVAGESLSLAQAGKSLLRSQEQYNAVLELFDSKMASYARIRRIRRFGSERRDAWRGWAAHVCTAVERCRRPIDELNRTMFKCWQEVADRVGMSTVSVQSTSIGQQISMSQSEKTVDAMT
jgi:hypothetical protein